MGKHLDRLGDKGDGRIFNIEKRPDGTFNIAEACDGYFGMDFTAEQLRELAVEIIEISNS